MDKQQIKMSVKTKIDILNKIEELAWEIDEDDYRENQKCRRIVALTRQIKAPLIT